jgi:hypothetical protein
VVYGLFGGSPDVLLAYLVLEEYVDLAKLKKEA